MPSVEIAHLLVHNSPHRSPFMRRFDQPPTSADWVNDKPGSKTSFGDVTLERTADSAGRNPYLLAYVDKQLIRDHNDIDDPRVFEFVKQLILISIQSPEQAIRHLEMSATTP